MVDSLGQLNAVKVGKDAVGVTHEMLVHEVHKLVLGAVLHLIVVLGLAECGEVLGPLELVKVDLNLPAHALTGHGLTAIAEEFEVLHATDDLEIVHDALANHVSLLRVSKDGNGLVQIRIAA